jgi:hypothetical protein
MAINIAARDPHLGLVQSQLQQNLDICQPNPRLQDRTIQRQCAIFLDTTEFQILQQIKGLQ